MSLIALICMNPKLNLDIWLIGNLGPYEGGKPDATFSFKDDDFVKIATGKMNPQIAFMRYSYPSIYPFQFLGFFFQRFDLLKFRAF